MLCICCLLALLIPLKDTSILKKVNLLIILFMIPLFLAASSNNISTSINEVYSLGEDLSKGNISKNEAN